MEGRKDKTVGRRKGGIEEGNRPHNVTRRQRRKKVGGNEWTIKGWK